MVIKTLKHSYSVIHKSAHGRDFELFLCKELKEETQTRYAVIKFINKEITYKLITVFMEQMSNASFRDYYECFSKDGDLYAVFLYSDYPLLADKLKNENCSLKERLELGKNILEKILILNMPDFLLYDALSEQNITVSAALEVQFNYRLDHIANFENLGKGEVIDRLGELFLGLFEKELKLEASEKLKRFVEHLKEAKYRDYFALFQEYNALYEDLLNADRQKAIKPNTFWFRLRQRAGRVIKFLKPVAAAALILVLAGYLVYSIFNRPGTGDAYNFKQIGTVTVDTTQ